MKKIMCLLLLAVMPAVVFCQTKPDKKAKKRDTIKIADVAERKLLVVKFYSIFTEEPNGDITAKYPIKIGYYTIDKGAGFPIGGSINGITLSNIKGRDLLVDTVKGVVIYKGVYH
jgi:hypothetical protein